MSSRSIREKIESAFSTKNFTVLECVSGGHQLIKAADQEIDAEEVVSRKGPLPVWILPGGKLFIKVVFFTQLLTSVQDNDEAEPELPSDDDAFIDVSPILRKKRRTTDKKVTVESYSTNNSTLFLLGTSYLSSVN